MSSAQRIYQSLHLRIMECTMKPGSIISKQNVADEMGYSQGPVRDALIRLESEGLVDIIPQSRTSVSLIDLRDAMELHFLRVSVEVEVARILAPQITSNQVRQLKLWIDRLKCEVGSKDASAFNEADFSFHAEMFDFANVSGLTSWIASRRGHYDRIRGLYMKDQERREEIIADHQEILNALMTHKSQASVDATRVHLGKSLAVVEAIKITYPSYFL
jgi:DNA-binding GntR family transcriptional regulator